MERKLDDVEEGRRSWTEFLHTFYDDFKETMGKAEAEMNRVQKPVDEMDEQCPDCGRNLVIRNGRFGRFISCSGFPECRYGRSFVNKTGALCPQCGGDLVERKTKQKKRIFYGCNNYPTCNFAIWERPVPELCPNCGGLMVVAKEGQPPVCYAEVIVPQRASQEKPVQEGQSGEKKTRSTRKQPAAATEAGEALNGTATKTVRKSTTAAKKKATVTSRVNGRSASTSKATKGGTRSKAKATTSTAAKKSKVAE
jgi:DNA topoisomerase I